MHHSHEHPAPAKNSAFLIGAALNVAYIAVEVTFGFLSNSLLLLADAGHNFSDVVILLLAWGANHLATIQPHGRHTYGYRRATILASFISGISLIVTVSILTWEAVWRLTSPAVIDSYTVVWVALAGVVVNFVTAALFISNSKQDLNVRGAFLHMIADGLVSVGVVVGGLIMLYTGYALIDPLLSLLIVLVIAYSAWELLHESFNLAVDAAPSEIDVEAVRRYLCTADGVSAVHDLHIWAMSTTQVALTAHLQRSVEKIDDEFLMTLTSHLKKKFDIDHVTIQVENGHCNLSCQHEHESSPPAHKVQAD